MGLGLKMSLRNRCRYDSSVAGRRGLNIIR